MDSTQRATVEAYNQRHIINLQGEMVNLVSQDSHGCRALNNELDFPSNLQLKIDTPVMMLQNLDVVNGWVNGMTDTVVRIDQEAHIVYVMNSMGRNLGVRKITRSTYKTQNTRVQLLYPRDMRIQ